MVIGPRLLRPSIVAMLCFLGAPAFAATHASGASAADVIAIKNAVIAARKAPATDWLIAAQGHYAVAIGDCGPGACAENQLTKRAGHWIVGCMSVEGKGTYGTCPIPSKIAAKLRARALSFYHGP